MVTRVPVLEVRPCLDRGRFPAKVVPGEELKIDAIVLSDDVAVGAAVVLTDPSGLDRPPVPMQDLGDDFWTCTVVTDDVGDWSYRIMSWQEPLRTWAARVVPDIERGADIVGVLAHGSSLLLGIGDLDPAALQISQDLLDDLVAPHERLAEALVYIDSLPEEVGRVAVEIGDALPLRVDPQRALVGAWYQLFPWSEGAIAQPDGSIEPGNLRSAVKRLEAVAAMGFDVVRLPPVHPTTSRDPWEVGAASGGHLAIDPRLGTLDDFATFVSEARRLRLEVALELSWTVTSAHPWLAEHPQWLVPTGDDTWRLDVDADPDAVYRAVHHLVTAWIDRGVTGFVVQDAHRWPLVFWEHLLGALRRDHPDVVLLAEGDSSPAQAHALAMAGFHQTTPPLHRALGARDVEAVLQDMGRGAVSRGHLLASSSHRIAQSLTPGSVANFRAWAGLAALGSPAWGMATGFEHAEGGSDRAGRRRSPDVLGPVVRTDRSRSLEPFIARLNELRRLHPALLHRKGLVLHRVHHAGVVAFSRVGAGEEVLVVVDLFPAFSKSVSVQAARPNAQGRVRDVVDDSWHDVEAVQLDPEHPVRVFVSSDERPAG